MQAYGYTFGYTDTTTNTDSGTYLRFPAILVECPDGVNTTTSMERSRRTKKCRAWHWHLSVHAPWACWFRYSHAIMILWYRKTLTVLNWHRQLLRDRERWRTGHKFTQAFRPLSGLRGGVGITRTPHISAQAYDFAQTSVWEGANCGALLVVEH